MRLLLTLSLLVLTVATIAPAADPPPDGDATIRGRAGGSEIVITTSNRTAGAINSLTWNGKEFLDSFDHGRELQSAANFDCARPLLAEAYNPTEAGSAFDGVGDRSTSRLLKIRASGATLETTVQMAFWLRPGERSGDHLAYNTKVLSDILLAKRVHIGHKSLPHAIEYNVTFTIPKGERHTHGVMEALTAYMPEEFTRFWRYDLKEDRLKPLSDEFAEQPSPVVFSTLNGSHAMGVYSPDQPSRGFENVGYGRFRFPAAHVVKWNCVFRIGDPKAIKPGDYSYRMFVVVGNLLDAQATLQALHKEFKRP